MLPIDATWNQALDHEQVLEHWVAFAHLVNDENKRLGSILINHKPNIKGDGITLVIELKNKTQETEINRETGDILNYIRHHVKNANIQLESVLVSIGKSTKAFTVEEKAKIMADKNPALLLLTKAFDLSMD